MAAYITSDGDSVDCIAWKYYGAINARQVEQVLDANPHLADRGPSLPGGLEIELPDISAAGQTQGVRLWD